MTDETILRLAAVRRVATRAGAVKFNKQIGAIISSSAAPGQPADSATLTKLLSLYNQMRAAKLYGQPAQFQAALASMNQAVDAFAKASPGGADKIRGIVKKLSFADESAARQKAIAAGKKTNGK